MSPKLRHVLRPLVPAVIVTLIYLGLRAILAHITTTASPIGPEANDSVFLVTVGTLFVRFVLLFLTIPIAVARVFLRSVTPLPPPRVDQKVPQSTPPSASGPASA